MAIQIGEDPSPASDPDPENTILEEHHYSSEAQVAAVFASTFLAGGYAIGMTYFFVDGAENPGAWFLILCFIFIGIFVLASSALRELLPGRSTRSPSAATSFARVALWSETILAATLLGWVCHYTGGPVTSPFAVTLLAMALLSPFVTSGWKPGLLVFALVTTSYLLFWWIQHQYPPKSFPDAIPEWLVAVTSLISVIISLCLEFVRRFVDSKTPPDDQQS